jgi:hypothetical protein
MLGSNGSGRARIPEALSVEAEPVKRTKIARDLKVDPEERPGWVSAAERLPSPGELVYCAEGAAELVRVVGKTGSGAKLLELKMADGRRHPFFAADHNVRVAPVGL